MKSPVSGLITEVLCVDIDGNPQQNWLVES